MSLKGMTMKRKFYEKGEATLRNNWELTRKNLESRNGQKSRQQ